MFDEDTKAKMVAMRNIWNTKDKERQAKFDKAKADHTQQKEA